MLVVVTGVSLMVQIYSLGYMRGDPGYARYFAFMSLFTASMLGLVLISNILLLYAFWELVGVSSYLLIGFWHERPAAAAAAKKAFIITRIGDVGFLVAILYLFLQADKFAAAGLECDSGSSNSVTAANACRSDCTLAVCGDGVTDNGEQCDDGEANSDTQADACRTDCSLPVCGDGVIDAGEECDPGANTAVGSACTLTCTIPEI